MTGQNRIIAFGSGGNENPAGDEPQTEQEEDRELLLTDSVEESSSWAEDETDGEAGYRQTVNLSWLPPAFAALAAAMWTGFFGWASWNELQQGITPAGWSGLIGDWAVPMMLVGVAWLLVMRNSRREANRFGDAARLLADESSRLETRLLTVNRELSLAREFVGAQSRDLEALGRITADRLTHNADRLQELIRDNGERVELLGTVSEAALENMEKLRGQLPVIAGSAKDVTNNIANAGRNAHLQIEELVSGFKRLNEFGQACSREVLNLRDQTGETIAEFQRHCDQMEEIATTRFAALNEQGAEFRTRLDIEEVEALAAIRTRAAALDEELGEARKLLESEEEESLGSLRTRLSAMRDEGEEITRSLLEGERQALAEWKSGLAAFEADRSELFAGMQQAQDNLAASAQARLQTVARDAETIESQLAESSRSITEGLDRQHEQLQSRHEQAIVELAQKCAALDAQLSERVSAILSQIELHQGRIGENHASLLVDMSARFEALEDEATERSERISQEIGRRRSEFAAGEEQAIAGLRELLAAMDQEIAQRLAEHQHKESAIAQQAKEVTAELEESGQRLTAISAQSEEAQEGISKGLESITNGVVHAQSLLGQAESKVAELTDASVRLLELIQASAHNSRTDLPEALDKSEQRLAALDDTVTRIGEALELAGGKGEAIAGRIEYSGGALTELISQAEALNQALQDHGSEHAAKFASLLQSLEELDSHSQQIAGKAQAELSLALDRLSQSARDAFATIGETGASNISELAGKIGTESAEAIDRAIRNTTAEASGKLEQAAAHASGVSREATIQLRDQLAKVNELVSNLEQRITHARARAEEQVDNDFARRVALITESLNSNSIDIAKALSTEVTDTAWASYLRGDRGIFTRRAVNLIEASEAKAIQEVFERDQDFREHVSRYVHDFEAILRQVLSTRDGHALGVTLLSSDMGKLYVALAQGIERLRD